MGKKSRKAELGERSTMRTRLILAAILACFVSAQARAQDAYPTRVVRVIVPYTPGGITDILARVVAEGLSRSMGQQFIVENRPGGGTTIGTRAVVTAPPDGYTLLMGTTVLSINPGLMPKLDYDAAKDLVPIVNVGESSGAIIAVPGSSPVKTLAELVALEKSKPGQLTFGTAGAGSIGHIAGEQFNQLAGTKFTHVAYRGSAPVINDAVGGHIPLIFDGVISTLPHIQAGKLRALAILQTKRVDVLPDVPTSAEAGFPELISTSYYGYLAPRGTPQTIVTRLNAEINKILAQGEVQEKIKQQGATLVGGSPEDFAKTIETNTKRYGEIIRKANISVEAN
jgi:tripartite-type tricarboxylate transporter receptor subunit TctC